MIGPRINSNSCKGCGLCISFCPKNVLGLSEEINARGVQYAVCIAIEECNGCGICYQMCPDAAIEVVELKTEDAVLEHAGSC